MTFDSSAALARVSAYLRASITLRVDHLRVAPFTIGSDPHSNSPYRNYAVPDDGAEPQPAAVAALIDAFARRSRMPRLEFLPAMAPAVLPALHARGFLDEALMPLLTKLREVEKPVLTGVTWSFPSDREGLRAAAQVQNDAYNAGLVTSADVERLARTVASGGRVLLACDKRGRGLASGLHSSPILGACEVAAVGVLEAERGRGLAQGTAWRLAEAARGAGVTLVFLMAEEANVARVYARAGFQTFGEVLHISRPG